MSDIYEIKKSLNEAAIAAYTAEYEALTDVWKGLETKAQGAITIAGIFIAAAFVFIRDLQMLNLSFSQKLLLAVAVACIVLSVIASILVLILQTVDSPPGGSLVYQMCQDVILQKMGETVAERDSLIPDLSLMVFGDQISIWEKAIVSTTSVNKQKVFRLRAAQWLLVAAVMMIVWLTITIIIR